MIYLVEDDENIRKLVCYALNKEGFPIQGFPSPSEFWQRIEEEVPSLVILDIMLPGEDGLSVLKKLKSKGITAKIPVIMLTAKGSEYDKVTGLDMGADDYISKPFGVTELAARVRAVMRRCGLEENKKADYRIGPLYVNLKKHVAENAGAEVALSYKEFCLLTVLLEARGNVVSRDELLTKVWGEFYDESRTLDVHIRKLRVKLGEAGELIKTVKNVGYKIEGEIYE